MKTLFLIVVVIICLNSSAFSQTPNDTTDGWLNGREWNTLTRLDKVHFIEGLYTGLRLLADDLDTALPNQTESDYRKDDGLHGGFALGLYLLPYGLGWFVAAFILTGVAPLLIAPKLVYSLPSIGKGIQSTHK